MRIERLVVVRWLEWFERVLLVTVVGVVAGEASMVVVLRVGRILAQWLFHGVPIWRAPLLSVCAWSSLELWIAGLLIFLMKVLLVELWLWLERHPVAPLRRAGMRREHI